MAKANKFLCTSALIGCLAAAAPACAEGIKTNTARMQAMDKITGRISEIDVPVNGEVKFGSFSIVVRDCKTTPPEETPENYAFVDVTDTTKDGKLYNIFKGWMISSSPALNAVEHPIYDVWLLKCLNANVKKEKLLTAEMLNERDGLPKKEEMENLSKEALKAAEIKAEEAEKQSSEAAAPLSTEAEAAAQPLPEVPVLEEKVIEVESIQDAKGVNEVSETEGGEVSEQKPQMLLNIEENATETTAPSDGPQSLIPADDTASTVSSESPAPEENKNAEQAETSAPQTQTEEAVPAAPESDAKPAAEKIIINEVQADELPVVDIPEENEIVEEEDQFLDEETQNMLENELDAQ